MKLRITWCIITLFLLTDIAAQTREEVLGFRGIMKPDKHHVHYGEAKAVHNELDFIFSGLFIFYKSFVSSQDAVSCVFYPSCSLYSIQAIQKKGLFRGTLMTFDRLSRCNYLSPEEYPVYPNTRLLYDPVE